MKTKDQEDIHAMSQDEAMQHAKDVIVEYHETHTKEEYGQFLDWLNGTYGKDRRRRS